MVERGINNPRDWLVRHGCHDWFLNLIIENPAEVRHLVSSP